MPSQFWEILWKFWILGSFIMLWSLINRKSLSLWFFSIILWFKEGVEDADGQLNSKDLWLMVFSICLLVMGFLEWATQKPFSNNFWAIISVLTGGGAISKGIESYFINKKAKSEKDPH